MLVNLEKDGCDQASRAGSTAMALHEDAERRLRAALADRYSIESEIGSGGMATVYLAQDLKHDRKVALKVMRPALSEMLGDDRFLREVRITAKLTHPHILPLYDSGSADGLLYYVMPYVEGGSLRDRLDRETQLPVEEARSIAKAVASALDYAHRHNVVHRDIKPANILLHEGEPLVADFGIALAVSAAGRPRLTETGLSLGTPQYMSPEQAGGEDQVDHRTDTYSLGCVLYEMLGGEPPFTGPNPQAVIARHLRERVPSLAILRPNVKPEILDAVLRALEKIPADRFQTISAFVEALESGTGAIHTDRPPSNRLLAKILGTVGGLCAVGLVLFKILVPPDPPE
ncbi:MAG: serine/threonine protein kinase, partial [Gemmatimonadetes bacterium]|nr:serine/threonine protein kinase [Gemmatimonadota bacterium]